MVSGLGFRVQGILGLIGPLIGHSEPTFLSALHFFQKGPRGPRKIP